MSMTPEMTQEIIATNSMMIESGWSEELAMLVVGISAFVSTYAVIIILVNLLMIISMWIIFKKAGKPGWAAIVPFYNIYVFFQVAWWNGWNVLWILLAPVLFVLMIIAQFDMAKKFGKNAWRGLGLWLLGIVFYPILAFGDAKYKAE